jgi:hypothetical protein
MIVGISHNHQKSPDHDEKGLENQLQIKKEKSISLLNHSKSSSTLCNDNGSAELNSNDINVNNIEFNFDTNSSSQSVYSNSALNEPSSVPPANIYTPKKAKGNKAKKGILDIKYNPFSVLNTEKHPKIANNTERKSTSIHQTKNQEIKIKKENSLVADNVSKRKTNATVEMLNITQNSLQIPGIKNTDSDFDNINKTRLKLSDKKEKLTNKDKEIEHLNYMLQSVQNIYHLLSFYHLLLY